MKKRIEYFDIAKGIGILCIIAGHMGIRSADRIVYPFHVPIFFLISGYFLSEKGTFWQFAARKARSLLVPYALTSLLLIFLKIPVDLVLRRPGQIPADLLQTFLAALYGSGAGSNKTLFGISSIGAIWFLPALFWSVLLVRWMREKHSKWGFPILALICLISILSARTVWLPFDLQAGGAACVFVYVGTILRKYEVFPLRTGQSHIRKSCAGVQKSGETELLLQKSVHIRQQYILEILFLTGVIALILEYHFRIRVLVVQAIYKYGIVSMAGSVMISCGVIVLSFYLEKMARMKVFRIPAKVLLFYGKNSLLVLCIHLIELNNAPWYLVFKLPGAAACPTVLQKPCIYLMKLVFCGVCVKIVRGSRILGRIFGGKE